MANEANDKNFKNKLTDDLKKKIQESVKSSFEKNVGGKGKTKNAGIRDFEKGLTDDFKKTADEGRENYENVRERGREIARDKARDLEKRAVDARNRYAEKGNAMKNKLKSGKERFQNPTARQAETRRIKENIKKSRENIKKSVKEKGKKIEEKTRENIRKRKTALKSKLREKAKKKLSMNAQKGKSGCITILFFVALLLALLNDSLDIIATIAAWIIGLVAAGVGVAISVPAVEVILDVIDIITTFLLVLFSFYVGGKTKGGATKQIKPLLRCVGGAAIELVPVVNLFATWVVVVLLNWHEARKRASEAEKNAAEIGRLRG